MTPKKVHDTLLSLLVRGLGIWLLYLALSTDHFVETLDNFYMVFHPDINVHPTWEYTYMLFFQLLVAAYFILGAPPFLKAATRSKDAGE